MLEHVLVPMSVRALHRQQVELLTFQNELDRDRNCLPRLPTDDADFDLLVTTEATLEVVLEPAILTSLRFTD